MKRQVTLRDLRLARNLSQNQVGEMIGCSRSMLSLFERGCLLPSQEQLEALEDVLGPQVRDVIDARLILKGVENRMPVCKQNRRNCCANKGGQCVALRDTTFNRPCPFYLSKEDHAKIMEAEAEKQKQKKKGRGRYYVTKEEQKHAAGTEV
jgi:transcriptional regulator with XRE-family HTH domain